MVQPHTLLQVTCSQAPVDSIGPVITSFTVQYMVQSQPLSPGPMSNRLLEAAEKKLITRPR